jgi:hypothetical protein
MWPYFIMFALPAIVATAERRRPVTSLSDFVGRVPGPWVLVAVVLTFFIGFRFEVGGDWGNYLKNLDQAAYRDFYDALTWSDPGYRLIEWLITQLDLGIVSVNIICAFVFSAGLVIFCCSLPRPWLALAIAIPYLVIIVGMGYTRQGMAIGCAMIGLVALQRQKVRQFLFWLLLAATFHKSAILLMPIPVLTASKQRIWVILGVIAFTFAAYTLLLQDAVEDLSANYLEAQYESDGALIRLLMNSFAAILFIAQRKRFPMNRQQIKLWTWFSAISLLLLIGYFVSPSSTAVDRVALYMLPLQLVVFASLPEVLGKGTDRKQIFVIAILLYYACVEIVWLNFATNASYWIPYRIYFIDGT